MHKILISLLLVLLPVNVFATGMDVTTDTPSGTYHAPIYVTLTPTDSNAKTFYSFKPDGYPNDAFLYTGAILIKHSTPIIYFSFLDTSHESKIKQNDYIFEYSSDIRFVSESLSGSGKISIVLVNNGTEPVNIGFWYVQSESDTSIIPEGTMLAPGEKYTAHLTYAGTSALVLRSPDDDEKDLFVPVLLQQQADSVRIPKKPIRVVTKVVPRKIISTAETMVPTMPVVATQEPSVTTSVTPSTSPSPVEPSIVPPKNSEIIPTPPMGTDINQIAKASVSESGKKTIDPLYIFLFIGLSCVIGWARFLLYKKQK